MKKFLILFALLFTCGIMTAEAQTTATQTVTLTVGSVYKMSVSGNPSALVISDGTAGTDALTQITDNTTTYSITQNVGNTVKLTAHLDAVLPSGYTLVINLASTKGTSGGNTDISNATSGTALDVVTGINRGADANQTITYTFDALASSGTLSSTKTVTFTLTN